jgi:hypothetical protein
MRGPDDSNQSFQNRCVSGRESNEADAVVAAGRPDIKAALQRGHTLKVVHARILESGIEMSLDLLPCCVRRLRREDSARPTANPPAPSGKRSTPDGPTESPEVVRDPMANVRDLLGRNRPGLHFDGEIPDKNKLY